MANKLSSASLDHIYEFRSGLSKPRSEFGSGFPFLGFRDVFKNYFVPDQLTELVNSTEKEREACSIQRGDVFLTRTSETANELGMSCVALKDYYGATFNGFTKRLRPKPGSPIVPEYAGYYFRGPAFRRAVTAMSTLSTRASLNNEMLERLTIEFPEPEVQRAIGFMLKRLDDKIELNRRMNRTLEKMAAALFKSWFIDFDPVRAKAEGQDTGMPKEIANLFPDTFEDSELGEIPKGWSVGPLSEIATLQTKTVQPGKRPETLWEHYSIPAFDEGRQPKWERGGTIKSGKYAVPHNSVLASKLNPRFPRIWLPEITDSDVAICSTEFMPFVPVQENWRPFLYELIKSPTVQEEIRSRVSGSTGSRQRVKPKDIAIVPVVIPKSEIINAFCDIVGGMHKKLLGNRRNSLSLAQTRDRLLPRLLSGELEVPKAILNEEVA